MMLLKIPNNGAHLVSFGTRGQQWWGLDPWIEGFWTLRILLMIPQKFKSKSEKIHFLLFICYCSLVTIYDNVHSEFCLFKGGCPLSLKQVFLSQRFSFGENFLLELFPFWKPFFERFPYFTLAFTTTLQFCN